jgi:hypothetical protein
MRTLVPSVTSWRLERQDLNPRADGFSVLQQASYFPGLQDCKCFAPLPKTSN